jgi:hypothetical protein
MERKKLNPSTPDLVLWTFGPGPARPDCTIKPGLPLVIGNPGLLIYKLIYIYIYIYIHNLSLAGLCVKAIIFQLLHLSSSY